MKVLKRNGTLEPVNLDKIMNSVQRVCEDIDGVDFYKIATKTVGGLYDGVSTKDLDLLSINIAVNFISEDPLYGHVASRLLNNFITKEVTGQEIQSFSQSIQVGFDNGIISQQTYDFVMNNKRKLNSVIKNERSKLFDYYGLKVIYDRYLIKNPHTRLVTETPQYWLLRVSCGLNDNVKDVVEFYNTLSSLDYMTSTPTLFNSGTVKSQMSSCYLLDSPQDDLLDIEKKHKDIAMLSKFAGGIGLDYSRVRGAKALIKGTNGLSNGIVPFLHSLSSNIAAVNQGGKRKGAAAVYLQPHHPDINAFLELRDQGGDKEARAYNLNLANWIPDIFMERVKKDEMWSLIDPTIAPELGQLFGKDYEKRYTELENEGKITSQISARKLWSRMMRTLAETGNGWMCFKDTSNLRCNTAVNGRVVKSSNLCTEIIEPTSSGEYVNISLDDNYTIEELSNKLKNENLNVIGFDSDTNSLRAIKDGEIAVCNLGSISLGRHIKNGKLDKEKLARTVRLAVINLDRVIDKNFYPVHEARMSNHALRPVGLGIMGFQDMLFQMRIPFESAEATKLSADIQEEIYYHALKTSMELSKKYGPHSGFEHTHAAKGNLQFDLAGVTIETERWNTLKEDIKKYGLRNSLLLAIAPTVTIAAITGQYECIEPQITNIYKTETLSGEFVRINKYLVDDLKNIGLWKSDIIDKIKNGDGSIQHILEIPQDIRNLYKTAWEIKQKYLIDHAVARGIFIDQSQSLNLFMRNPTIEKLSSMYMYIWEKGLKTTYYLRSRPASEIQKTTTTKVEDKTTNLENPEICESCT